MSVVALNLRNRDPRHLLGAAAYQGRSARRVAGGHIADLAALGKTICLCEGCRPKFNESRHGYLKAQRFPLSRGAVGRCDGCKSDMEPCQVFFPQER